jgi:hypothetical protein
MLASFHIISNSLFADRLIPQCCILWHIDPLLGNDRKISNYTTTVTRHRTLNSNRGTVFSVRSVPRCYKQDKLVRSQFVCWLVGESASELENRCGSVVVSCCCEKLVAEVRG